MINVTIGEIINVGGDINTAKEYLI